MKTKIVLVLMLCATIPAIACAKKPKKNQPVEPATEVKQEVAPAAEEVPVLTEECAINLSLFYESAKNKQYADAYEPWRQVYDNCPNASKNIYTKGVEILKYKYNNAANDEERDMWRKEIMTMYDKRAKWFGDDPNYPTAYILGLKALDYCTYFPEDTLMEDAYGWFKTCVQTMGAKTQLPVVTKFAEISNKLYKSNPEKYGEQYIEDYQTATGILVAMSKDAANKQAGTARQFKDYIDGVFAVSGAANCDKLDELYATQVEASVNDLEMLNKFITLYSKIGCQESEVYFAASEAAHKLQPTESSAAGCAKMCIKKKEINDAIGYYEQAANLAEDKFDKADYYYYIAMLYASNNSYSKSREYANKALGLNPDMGKCYLLIGKLYASSQPYANDAKGRILNKTVYWAAVDKFVKAKQVDANLTEEANKLISLYSRYFPTKEERFDLPAEFSGSSFYVGGWIGESTAIR